MNVAFREMRNQQGSGPYAQAKALREVPVKIFSAGVELLAALAEATLQAPPCQGL